MTTGWMIYLTMVTVASVTTFGMYAWDKRQARLHRWRTPEATLHLLALAGGFPGALAARRLLRHKTQKLAFSALLYAITAAHLATAAAAAYLMTT